MVEALPARRPWFQFSLRTLFLAVLVLSVFSAVAGWWTHRAQRQRASAEALGNQGVAVFYTERDIPAWLVSFFGDDYFQNVDSVMDLGGGTSSTSEAIRLLDGFPHLHGIRFSRPNISEEDLRSIGRRSELQSICLFGADDLPESGLRHLGQLHELRQLRIQTSGIGVVGLGAISQLPNLVELELFKVEISDRAISQLVGMKGLETLNLQQCSKPITDEDLRRIGELKHLTQLLLSPSQVSDAELNLLRRALPDCRILLPDNTVGANSGSYMPLNDPGP